MARKSEIMTDIKLWRQNAGLTQVAMSAQFEIPRHTIEEWDMGRYEPNNWTKKLLLEKLQRIAGAHIRGRVYNDVLARYPDSPFNIAWIVSSHSKEALYGDILLALAHANAGDKISCVAIIDNNIRACAIDVQWEV